MVAGNQKTGASLAEGNKAVSWNVFPLRPCLLGLSAARDTCDLPTICFISCKSYRQATTYSFTKKGQQEPAAKSRHNHCGRGVPFLILRPSAALRDSSARCLLFNNHLRFFVREQLWNCAGRSPRKPVDRHALRPPFQSSCLAASCCCWSLLSCVSAFPNNADLGTIY